MIVEQKIKIVYMINSLKIGGPVNMLYNLVKYLDKEKFDVTILAFNNCSTKIKKDFSNLNCSIIELEKSNFKDIMKSVTKIIDEIKPDIIHSHGGIADIVNSKIKSNIKSFTTVHCVPDEDFIMKKGRFIGGIKSSIFINTMKKIDYPIACSKTVSDKIYKRRNIKIEYIRNGIDLQDKHKKSTKVTRNILGIEEDKIVLLFCGYLSKRKNVKFLFENLKDIKRDDIVLLVLGDGNQYDELQSISKLDSRIKMIGRVDNAFEYLNCADYFISSSLSEGLPLAVMEGMSSGLPAILSDIDSHKELLKLCNDGIKTFSLKSNDELREILNNLDKKYYEEEKKAVIYVMETNLNAERMAKEYMVRYDNALYKK